MLFRALGLCFLLTTTFAFAEGRSPAVEDFVGIEVDQGEATPAGSEVLYNLEQDLNKIEAEKNKPVQKIAATPVAAESSGFSMKTIFAITLVIGLPLMVWLMIMYQMKKKATLESASNIKVLEKYRKDREKKSEESIKKAS